MAPAAVESASRRELEVHTEERQFGAEHTPIERGGSPMDGREAESDLQFKTFDQRADEDTKLHMVDSAITL